jgi:uncharacterized membrane-anchored protein YhcB (DUF1043 family)
VLQGDPGIEGRGRQVIYWQGLITGLLIGLSIALSLDHWFWKRQAKLRDEIEQCKREVILLLRELKSMDGM